MVHTVDCIYHWLTAGDFLSESWLEGVLPWGGPPTPPGPRSPTGPPTLGPPTGPPPPQELGPPVIGESEKPWLSWSNELAASYWVFSSLVMSRSSSSPNSPPISDGSPTTITSCQGAHRAHLKGFPGPILSTTLASYEQSRKQDHEGHFQRNFYVMVRTNQRAQIQNMYMTYTETNAV